MEKVIMVKNLKKEFRYYKKDVGLLGSFKNLFSRKVFIKRAVNNVSFTVNEGEFVGFIGPNGAGKTTTIKMLSGILVPTSGRIEAIGYEPAKRNPEYQKQFGVVLGQKNQIHPDLPPSETLLLMKEMYGVSDKKYKEKIDELTNLLDVKDILNVQARKLSLGQRMKCELMAALIHSPKILFLDEPTIGLDITSQQKIREFLSSYNKLHKTTIILTSHYMQDIERLCERIIIIDVGKIIFDDTLKTLTKEYVKNKKIEIFIAGTEKIDIEKASKLGRVVKSEGRKIVYEVPREKVASATAKILDTLNVSDLAITEIDIEEIISDIFKKNK